MKSVSFEQMEAINGGGPASLGYGLLMTAWGGVLAAGLALGPVSAGAGRCVWCRVRGHSPDFHH